MSTQILRPLRKGLRKNDCPFVLQGPWGKREYPPGTVTDLRDKLHQELRDSGIKVELPSRRYAQDLNETIMHCSWIGRRWVKDEDFGTALKELRQRAGLTQEGLAEKSRAVDPKREGVPLPTIRNLEQGLREAPRWDTVSLLVAALGCGLGALAHAQARGE